MNRSELSILDTLETARPSPEPEDAQMSSDSKSRWGKPRSRSRSRNRHRRGRRSTAEYDEFSAGESDFEQSDALDVFDDRSDSPSREERQFYDARMQAEDRAELLLKAAKMGFVGVLLLVFLPPIGFLVLVFWPALFPPPLPPEGPMDEG
ncbi:MAG: hypothetical protein ACE1ZP_06105, partial [Myxococcota bacterium]